MADERAAKCLTRVIRKRLRLLASLLAEMGMAQEDAALRARMLMGFMQLDANYLPRETRQQREQSVVRGLEFILS
jgi:hypothetical protein